MKNLAIVIVFICLLSAGLAWMVSDMTKGVVLPLEITAGRATGHYTRPQLIYCDPSLWQHIYHGRFPTPQDRLKIIEPCKIVTGVLKSIKYEADGDIHARLQPDQEGLTNSYNQKYQHGDLVLETICNRVPTQTDTQKEGVCTEFSQAGMLKKDMVEKRIEVIGVYVEDAEHHWRELHPISSIRVIQ